MKAKKILQIIEEKKLELLKYLQDNKENFKFEAKKKGGQPFCEKIGMYQSNLNNFIEEKRNLSFLSILEICKKLDI